MGQLVEDVETLSGTATKLGCVLDAQALRRMGVELVGDVGLLDPQRQRIASTPSEVRVLRFVVAFGERIDDGHQPIVCARGA
jgi:hypothetical protein